MTWEKNLDPRLVLYKLVVLRFEHFVAVGRTAFFSELG